MHVQGRGGRVVDESGMFVPLHTLPTRLPALAGFTFSHPQIMKFEGCSQSLTWDWGGGGP